jgi:hypothetical protein
MRYLSVNLLFICILAACSPTETIQDEVEPDPVPEPEEEISDVPDWYDGQVFSSADSISFYGFSMASATDSAEAAELSAETALQNLRFEIDRHAEDARVSLINENGDEEFSGTSFIIQLRNTVREMELEGYELDQEHEQSVEGVHYVYTRAVFPRGQLSAIFEPHISNEQFLEKLRTME